MRKNMQSYLSNLIAVSAVLLLSTAWANDGFYQGSGSTLKLVKNSHLRVREESLLISPITPTECYLVYANGKVIMNGMDLNIGDANISIGDRAKCQDGKESIFYAKWKATANYQVEALQSQKDVLIGFPVDSWRSDFIAADGDLYYLHAPSVANFHTYIDDEEIRPLELKKLKDQNSKIGMRDELGYTWTASFEGGKSYRLKTEYDFGVDSSNAFYKGREYLTGETPWFLEVMPEPFSAERIIYFLTPISSWASPPPEQIKIEVQLPANIPVTYFVPLEFKPACITNNALHYQLRNELPSYELSLSMPNTALWKREKLKPMRTLKQWNKWQKTLGGKSIKIGCDIIEALKKDAAQDLLTHFESYNCTLSCTE